jgi:hypothetical protein
VGEEITAHEWRADEFKSTTKERRNQAGDKASEPEIVEARLHPQGETMKPQKSFLLRYLVALKKHKVEVFGSE